VIGELSNPGEEGTAVVLYSKPPRGLRSSSDHEQLINRTCDHDVILNADTRRGCQQPSRCPLYIIHTHTVPSCSSQTDREMTLLLLARTCTSLSGHWNLLSVVSHEGEFIAVSSGVPRNFFPGGGSKTSVEDRGQRERRSGAVAP
jgi:hypothetical protein